MISACIRRVKFKSYDQLEQAVLERKTVLFNSAGFYLDVVYRKSTNCICLMNINIGTVHDIWKFGKRTEEDEHRHPLDQFMMFTEI